MILKPIGTLSCKYPFRLIFECKAYSKKIGLPIVRNALGLRYDINEFEIITRNQLLERKNNRRSALAIDNRQRYSYQVGVATVEDFTKPAIEFSANNKIPLFSLRWILPGPACDLFHKIDDKFELF